MVMPKHAAGRVAAALSVASLMQYGITAHAQKGLDLESAIDERRPRESGPGSLG